MKLPLRRLPYLFENDGTKGFGQREAIAMLRDLQSDFSEGILEIRPVDWADVRHIAERHMNLSGGIDLL